MCSEVVTLISIAPNLKGAAGHDLTYHRSVGHALDLLGWQHDVLIPRDASAVDIPQHWKRVLVWKKRAKWNVFGRLEKAATVFGAVKEDVKANSKGGRRVYFLESFSSSQFAAVVLALITARAKNSQLWVLHRYRADQMRLAGVPNRLIQWVADTFKLNTKLLTDTQLLAQCLSKTFNRNVVPLPIPHIENRLLEINDVRNTSNQVWWWPGPPRKEKGWDIIKKIALEQNGVGEAITLAFAKSANVAANPEGVKIKYLPDSLSRDEYLSQLLHTNMVLLPYDSATYGMSSSGIFVEAVCSMVMPVVNAGTWMAWELERYNLTELTVDWNQKDLVGKLLSLSSEETVKSKFKKMSMDYRELHGVRAFGCKLGDITG